MAKKQDGDVKKKLKGAAPGAQRLCKVYWRHKKKQGEWSELRFMAAAFDHGFNVMRPWGDSSAYDVFLEQSGHVLRVQVKSAGTWRYLRQKHGPVYAFPISRNKGSMRYLRTDLDFYACYVIPLDLWYILPADVIRKKKTIFVCPGGKGFHYEQYRDAWDLLGKSIRKDSPGLTLHGCAEDGLTPGNGPRGALGVDQFSAVPDRL